MNHTDFGIANPFRSGLMGLFHALQLLQLRNSDEDSLDAAMRTGSLNLGTLTRTSPFALEDSPTHVIDLAFDSGVTNLNE